MKTQDRVAILVDDMADTCGTICLAASKLLEVQTNPNAIFSLKLNADFVEDTMPPPFSILRNPLEKDK